jgi:hypothetical protein
MAAFPAARRAVPGGSHAGLTGSDGSEASKRAKKGYGPDRLTSNVTGRPAVPPLAFDALRSPSPSRRPSDRNRGRLGSPRVEDLHCTPQPSKPPRSRVASKRCATGAGDCGDLAADGRAGADVAQQACQDRPNAVGALFLSGHPRSRSGGLRQRFSGSLRATAPFSWSGHQIIQLDMAHTNGRLEGWPMVPGRCGQALGISGRAGASGLARPARRPSYENRSPARCGLSPMILFYRALVRLARI